MGKIKFLQTSFTGSNRCWDQLQSFFNDKKRKVLKKNENWFYGIVIEVFLMYNIRISAWYMAQKIPPPQGLALPFLAKLGLRQSLGGVYCRLF